MTENYKKDFVPHEPSLALKELGFDEPCFGYYKENIKELYKEFYCYNSDYVDYNELYIAAPIFSQAFRWFREKHQLDTSINTVYFKYNDTLSREYNGVINDKSVFTNIGFYDTYEEAELACLKNLIEIVKNK